MAVRPTQRANGPTARLLRVATEKEKIKGLSCAPPEPPCWKPRAPRCLVELVHSRHTRFPKEARAGGGGQYSTVPYVAALRGNNRVRKHLCPTEQPQGCPKKPQGGAESLGRVRGDATGKTANCTTSACYFCEVPCPCPFKFVSKLLQNKL